MGQNISDCGSVRKPCTNTNDKFGVKSKKFNVIEINDDMFKNSDKYFKKRRRKKRGKGFI